MSNIKRMKDKDGNYIYPVTHVSAVFDDEGNTIEDKISEEITNSLFGIEEFGYTYNIYYPEEFPKLPFKVFKDVDNVYKHDFDINRELIGKNIYVSCKGGQGSDSTGDGLTKETCVTTLAKALQIANSLSDDTIIINILNDIVDKDRGLGSIDFIINKNIVIKHIENKMIYFTNANYGLSYTQSDNISKTNISSVLNCVDFKYVDSNKQPMCYKQVATLDNCKNENGSYFIDTNNDVYVNTIDGRVADDNIALNRNINSPEILIDKKLVFLNCSFILPHTSRDCVKVKGNSSLSTLINYNCVFSFGGGNGLATLKVNRVYSFNCLSFSHNADGFNYHSTLEQGPDELIFEYNCKAYNCGLNGLGINNATTAHEGVNVLRVNCVGYDCNGPVLADVNGCWSLNYNCIMYNSTRDSGSTKTGFWFDSVSSARNHKAWLIDCAGDSEYSLNGDETGDYFIRKFKGNKIPAHILNKINMI